MHERACYMKLALNYWLIEYTEKESHKEWFFMTNWNSCQLNVIHSSSSYVFWLLCELTPSTTAYHNPTAEGFHALSSGDFLGIRKGYPFWRLSNHSLHKFSFSCYKHISAVFKKSRKNDYYVWCTKPNFENHANEAWCKV